MGGGQKGAERYSFMACNVKLEFNVAEIRSGRQIAAAVCSGYSNRFASGFTRFLTH
jgi:hypothetical protein